MARIRSVKPEFWLDRKLARRLSRDQRMLYLGLWNQADEHGRGNADAVVIKGQVFPYDADITPDDIEQMLAALVDADVLVLYEVDDDPYLYLPNLAKHQRLEPHKVPSKYPAPPCPPDPQQSIPLPDSPESDDTSPGSHSDASAPRSDGSEPGADSSSLLYGTGSMEQGAGGRVPDRTRRATRIPEDFVPSEKARAAVADIGYSTEELKRITTEFIDYWLGVPGQKGLKLDWDATWRNRVRTVAERKPPARALRAVAGGKTGIQPWM